MGEFIPIIPAEMQDAPKTVKDLARLLSAKCKRQTVSIIIEKKIIPLKNLFTTYYFLRQLEATNPSIKLLTKIHTQTTQNTNHKPAQKVLYSQHQYIKFNKGNSSNKNKIKITQTVLRKIFFGPYIIS